MNILNVVRQFSISAAEPASILISVGLLLLLATMLAVTYGLKGNGLSNRWRLAITFPLLSLTTMLIILVVKSSLALSLGLVGALSIVRFRAAIKDPEELTYIFLAIAFGLGFGAEQVLITITFFVIALVVIFIQRWLIDRFSSQSLTEKDMQQLQLSFSDKAKDVSLSSVQEMIDQHASQWRLVRADSSKSLSVTFLVEFENETSFDDLLTKLEKHDSKVHVSMIGYTPIV